MTEAQRPAPPAGKRFEFVMVAAARARQLMAGCVPRVEGSAKPARRAVEEVAAGAVAATESDAG